MKSLRFTLAAIAFFGTFSLCLAQHAHTKLHVSDKWKECSIQLDPSLTQEAWHQFATEAALVTYFRPLTDAKPMGTKNFELSVLQWKTAIDDGDDAWNDTFVHPDSTHWLTEGSGLAFPGLTARAGITDKIDVGAYWTKNPNANYGFWGAQIQYNFVNNVEKSWAASGRVSFTSLYGPEDLKVKVYGVDLLVSKEFGIYADWAFVAPYAGISTYLSSAHEISNQVDLNDENVVGSQAMIGALVKLSIARLGVEYNFAKVNTLSFKIGVAF